MSTPPLYLFECVFCNKSFGGRRAKGNCKRHLTNQHIAPFVFQCKTCNDTFSSEKRATSHCKFCGKLGWEKRSIHRNLFGCPFTPNCFSAQHEYADHTVDLCELPHQNLESDHRQRLHALLEHPTYYEHLQTLSNFHLGSANGWKSLHWSEYEAKETATKLEYYTPPTSDGRNEVIPLSIRAFLTESIFTRGKCGDYESSRSTAEATYPLHESLTGFPQSSHLAFDSCWATEVVRGSDDGHSTTGGEEDLSRTTSMRTGSALSYPGNEQLQCHSNDAVLDGQHIAWPRADEINNLNHSCYPWPLSSTQNMDPRMSGLSSTFLVDPTAFQTSNEPQQRLEAGEEHLGPSCAPLTLSGAEQAFNIHPPMTIGPEYTEVSGPYDFSYYAED